MLLANNEEFKSLSGTPVAIDFETHLIGQGSIYPKPVCVSAFNGRDAFLFRAEEMEPFLTKLLKEDTIIAHNATFECGVIYHHFPLLREAMLKALDEGRIICTKINEELYNITVEKPKFKYSLADLVLFYFKEDISATKGEDAWRLRYNELEGVQEWPQEAIDYAVDDSIWAYKVFQKQVKMEQKLSVQSSVYLNLMGAHGMEIDLSRVQQLKDEIMVFLNPHYDFLVNEGYCHRLTPTSTPKKQMKKLRIHVESLNIDLMLAPKGGTSTTAEAMEYYLKQVPEDKILKAFSELAVYEKVLSAYISRLSESPICTQYSVAKSTGRTSSNGSSFYASLNIQQMPREVPNVSYDIRNCFVPRSGKKYVSIDYAGLELASTAHQLYTVYGKSKMRDTINSGTEPVDMHSMLASRIKGVTYEHFMEHKKEYKDTRQLAKPINLGFPGGIGYDTMRHLLYLSGIKTKFNVLHKQTRKEGLASLKLSLGAPDVRIARLNKAEWALVQDELVVLKREFFNLYPELERFLLDGHHKYETENKKWVKNEYDEWEEEPMYSYNIYGFRRDWCTYTAFCNGFLMQTPSAIGAKKSVNKIMRKYHDHPDITPLAFIHDEIIFEVTEDRKDLVDDVALIMVEEMQSVLKSVRITVEASMMDYWQKADGFWTKQYFKDPT